MQFKVKKIALLLVIALFTGFICGQNTLEHNFPEALPANSFFTVEISIKKGDISSFTKYQMDVPENITVTEGNSLDGHFSFENKRVKIVWVECPKQPVFSITMRMYIGFASGEGNFEHRFYYVEGNQRKEITDETITVKFLEPQSKIPVQEPSKTSTISIAKSGTVNLAEQKEPEKPVANQSTITIKEEKPVNSSNTVPVTFKEPVGEINGDANPVTEEIREYKVQIGSLASKPDLSKYAKAGKVSVYEENGMYKVLAGGYKTKEEAVKRMEELKTLGYQGFVVLLINGVKAK